MYLFVLYSLMQSQSRRNLCLFGLKLYKYIIVEIIFHKKKHYWYVLDLFTLQFLQFFNSPSCIKENVVFYLFFPIFITLSIYLSRNFPIFFVKNWTVHLLSLIFCEKLMLSFYIVKLLCVFLAFEPTNGFRCKVNRYFKN